jgi:hypothetical protein
MLSGGLAPIFYEIFTSSGGEETLFQVTRADQTTRYSYTFDLDLRYSLLTSIIDPRGYETRFDYEHDIQACAGKIKTIGYGRELVTVSPPTYDTYTYNTCPGVRTIPDTCPDSSEISRATETRVMDPNGHITTYGIVDPTVINPGPARICDAASRETQVTYDTGSIYPAYAITDIMQDLQSTHWEYGTRLLCFGEYQAHTPLAAAVCCLANKEAKRSSTLCPSWSRSCTERINACIRAWAC